MTPPLSNLTNATEFGKRMVAIMDNAATALLLIGHQTGLFDTLARMPGSTSTQLADAAGLNERYVREWLGGVASSGLVSYHADSATYFVPAEHIPALTTSVDRETSPKWDRASPTSVPSRRRSSSAFGTGAVCPTRLSPFPPSHGRAQ